MCFKDSLSSLSHVRRSPPCCKWLRMSSSLRPVWATAGFSLEGFFPATGIPLFPISFSDAVQHNRARITQPVLAGSFQDATTKGSLSVLTEHGPRLRHFPSSRLSSSEGWRSPSGKKKAGEKFKNGPFWKRSQDPQIQSLSIFRRHLPPGAGAGDSGIPHCPAIRTGSVHEPAASCSPTRGLDKVSQILHIRYDLAHAKDPHFFPLPGNPHHSWS